MQLLVHPLPPLLALRNELDFVRGRDNVQDLSEIRRKTARSVVVSKVLHPRIVPFTSRDTLLTPNSDVSVSNPGETPLP